MSLVTLSCPTSRLFRRPALTSNIHLECGPMKWLTKMSYLRFFQTKKRKPTFEVVCRNDRCRYNSSSRHAYAMSEERMKTGKNQLKSPMVKKEIDYLKDLEPNTRPLHKSNVTLQQQVENSKRKKVYDAQAGRPPLSLFITCLPGLEPLLYKEIQYLKKQWDVLDNIENHTATYSPVIIPGGVKILVPSLIHLNILCLYLGTASHIYLRLNDDSGEQSQKKDKTTTFSSPSDAAQIPPLLRARGFPELERKLKRLIIDQKWNEWLDIPNSIVGKKSNGGSRRPPWDLTVHVTTSKSKLMHTKAVEERVRKTMAEVLGINLDEEVDNTNEASNYRPVIRLLVRIEADLVQFSLDASSSINAVPMHMRGYRLNPYKAPLREDLAYALLLSGGLTPSWNLMPLKSLLSSNNNSFEERVTAKENEPLPFMPPIRLFDPCCGSGTIAIEGAAMLNGLPPGRNRSAPLLGTKFCNQVLWEDIKLKSMSASAKGRQVSSSYDTTDIGKAHVIANDVDIGAIEAAKRNAKNAGVDEFIKFTRESFHRHPIFLRSKSKKSCKPTSLLVVTNPPYGKRLLQHITNSTSFTYKKLATMMLSMSSEQPLNKICYAMIGNDPRPMRESGIPMNVVFSSKSGGKSIVAMAGVITGNTN